MCIRDRIIIDSYIRHLCSNFEDPVFGITESSIYAQYRINPALPPNFEGMVLDSLVLTMTYDSAATYGDISEMHEFEVYQIIEDLGTDIDIDYFSDQTFGISSTPVGSVQFFPEFTADDSLTVKEYSLTGDTTSVVDRTLAPHLRIQLDSMLGNQLLEIDSLSLIHI